MIFKFLSKAEDYFGFGRQKPTNEDSIVILLNKLRDDIHKYEDNKENNIKNLNKVLEELYKHCAKLAEAKKILENELMETKQLLKRKNRND